MLFKLIFFLLCLVVALFFIGFNLENRCDVSIIFHTFKDVPVVLSLLAAYVVGAFSVIPFLFGRRKKKSPPAVKEPKKKEDKQKNVPKNGPQIPIV